MIKARNAALIVGRIASAARRPDRRPHAADFASDRRYHSDASAACVGRNAADYAPTFSSSSESEDDCDKKCKKPRNYTIRAFQENWKVDYFASPIPDRTI